jgi:Rod binding domain-containing protein
MNHVGITPVVPLHAIGRPNQKDDPAKVRDAAQQFEALLIGQIMRSVRESGSGWLGSGGDASSDCAMDYAEQHLATVLAQQGGLGLTDLISQGLERKR